MMIKTDKYKNGIIALTQKAAEINPRLGYYMAHYLNDNGRFVIQLSNGNLQINIELARKSEENPEIISSHEIERVIHSYRSHRGARRINAFTESDWENLFESE